MSGQRGRWRAAVGVGWILVAGACSGDSEHHAAPLGPPVRRGSTTIFGERASDGPYMETAAPPAASAEEPPAAAAASGEPPPASPLPIGGAAVSGVEPGAAHQPVTASQTPDAGVGVEVEPSDAAAPASDAAAPG